VKFRILCQLPRTKTFYLTGCFIEERSVALFFVRSDWQGILPTILRDPQFFASSPGSGDSLYQISSFKDKNFLSAMLLVFFAELAMFQLGHCRQAGKKVA
jgi:hypothetical protein